MQQLRATETADLFSASSTDSLSPALYTSAFTLQLAQRFGPAIIDYARRLAAGNASTATDGSAMASTDATTGTTDSSTMATTPRPGGTQYSFDPFAPAADTQRVWGYDPFNPDS